MVRRFADALLEVGPAAGHDVVPVRVSGGRCFALPVQAGKVVFPESRSAREETRADSAGEPLLRMRRWGHRLNRVLGSSRLADWLDAGPNADGLARRFGNAAGEVPQAGSLALASSDIVLSLDSSWVYDIRSVLDDARRAGATRIGVLCDVLPLSHPQWFTEGTRRWFRGWLQAILPRLDGVIAISRHTCAELRRLVDGGLVAARAAPACTAVHLGAEVAEAGDGPVRAALREALAAGRAPAFVTVGTLEPRKNADFALDLFDHLTRRGFDVQWHFVGAPGWLAEATAQRIRDHAELGHRLHWWVDLTDDELAWCYRHAAALVAVSQAEGFGLPLVEARLQGLPVFASDIPVFREVLGGEARYLPLSSPRLAAVALEDFLDRRGRDPDARAAAAAPSAIARSWKASAGELLAAVEGIDRARRQGCATK